MLRPAFAIATLLSLAPWAAACSCSSGGACHCGDTCSCAGDSSPDKEMTTPTDTVTTADTGSPTTVHVGVDAFTFTANATIHVGDTVQWDWITGFHTITSVVGSAEEFDSGFQVEGSYAHLFTHPGTFWYYCQIHGYDALDGSAGGMAATVTVLPSHFAGDTNNDGVVDLTDLNNVLNNFGASGTNPGDDNADGTVDLTDLNNVLNNFGATHAASVLAVVPEPASLSLLAIGGMAVLARRRIK